MDFMLSEIYEGVSEFQPVITEDCLLRVKG